MQCKLCQLEYGAVDEQDLCAGCAEDMTEAERIVRTLKAPPRQDHSRIGTADHSLEGGPGLIPEFDCGVAA